MHHLEQFPVEVNTVPYPMLLRVPGIGPLSARRIAKARRQTKLDWEDLKRIGVVLKRAQYFITCRGKPPQGLAVTRRGLVRALIDGAPVAQAEQLSLFGGSSGVEIRKVKEAAAECLSSAM